MFSQAIQFFKYQKTLGYLVQIGIKYFVALCISSCILQHFTYYYYYLVVFTLFLPRISILETIVSHIKIRSGNIAYPSYALLVLANANHQMT